MDTNLKCLRTYHAPYVKQGHTLQPPPTLKTTCAFKSLTTYLGPNASTRTKPSAPFQGSPSWNPSVGSVGKCLHVKYGPKLRPTLHTSNPAAIYSTQPLAIERKKCGVPAGIPTPNTTHRNEQQTTKTQTKGKQRRRRGRRRRRRQHTMQLMCIRVSKIRHK